jgi:hypothetical protein
VRHERIGRERQHLVEQEQCDQVSGERNTHRRRERYGEHHVEARLVLFVVAAHVADRVQGIDDPQT